MMKKLHRPLLTAAACALAFGGTVPGIAKDKDKKEPSAAAKAARPAPAACTRPTAMAVTHRQPTNGWAK